MTFSTVLVDEAAQCMESATLPALVHGCERVILIGDQNQLPPVVSCPTALEHGLGVSLFARLAAGGMQPCLLDEQYRMHPKIADFSSSRFYGGRIRSRVAPEDRPLPLGFNWPNKKVPVVFMDVSPEDTYRSEEVVNAREGDVTAGGISFRKMLESPFQSLMTELEGSEGEGGSRVDVNTDEYGVESIISREMGGNGGTVSAVPVSGGFEGTSNVSKTSYSNVAEVEVVVSVVQGLLDRGEVTLSQVRIRSNLYIMNTNL
jgi:hypothetical protein